MPRKTLWACSLLGCIFTMATVGAAENPQDAKETGGAAEGGLETQDAIQPDIWRDVILPNGEKAGRLAPLPPNVEVRQLSLDGSGVTASSRVTTEIYSNTNPLTEVPGGGIIGEVFARGAGLRVSDDMTTTMVSPCPLSSVIVQVHGGNMDPDSDPGFFNATFGVWTSCPNRGGALLPGTSLHTENFLEDNILWELEIPLPTNPTPPTTTIWVSGNFSTNTAGFIVGSPPEKGFSQDGYDDPVFACTALFGEGFPTFLHSSWAAKVFAEGICETHFLAYAAINNRASTFDRGRGIRLADDLELIVPICELSTYEIAVRGQSTGYRVLTDLRVGDTESGPLGVIPGTEAIFQGQPPNITFFGASFPPGIALRETDGLWMTWSINRADTGLLQSGDAQVGNSTDFYAWEDPVIGWQAEFFPGPSVGIFYIAVNCRGDAPLGACCRLPTATSGAHGVCADQVPAPACPLGRWLVNDSPTDLTECYNAINGTPDPFNPPCGTAACCFETSSGASNCNNLTKAQCDAKNECVGDGCLGFGGIWQPGTFCGEPGQECFNFACYFADNECTEELFEIVCTTDEDCPFPYLGCTAGHICDFPNGCEDLRCCDEVCDADRFCCDPQNGWDDTCARRAQTDCSLEPTNDECYMPAAGQEAIQIDLTCQDNVCLGDASIKNMDRASRNPTSDPGFCCSNVAVDEPGYGTLWYWFSSGNNSSARITTCDSPGGSGQDSIIQTFRESPSLPGSWVSVQAACNNLGSAVACNDDSACGTDGRNSDLCVSGLKPNELVMVMIGAPSQAGLFGDYLLSIEAPCPSANLEPTYSACRQALGPIQGSASGIEDQVPFDCSGNPGTVCLKNTTLNCPGEPELPAMKNDIWIGYDPGCTGTLRLNTCVPLPPNPIPATTLAVYGPDPVGGGICPAQGGLLFGANDNAPVTPVEAQFNDQICSVGTESCTTSADCAMPGSTCIGGDCVLSCTTNANCQVDGVPIGECVGQVCVRPCETSADCPLKICTINGNLCDVNSDCSVGQCSWGGTTCDTGQPPTPAGDCPRVCREQPSRVCTIGGGECAQGDICITQDCERIETCDDEICQSSCWPGSALTVPVSRFDTYNVRLGGEYGGEPKGTLRLLCTAGDCNLNGVPDVCDVSCAAMDGCDGFFPICGTSPDCHIDGEPGYLKPDLCDIRSADGGLCVGTSPPCSRDCQPNGVPDECDVRNLTSEDCNNNNRPDECELATCAPGTPACADCQPNGILDECDIAAGAPDTNMNGIPDACEAAALAISWESVATHGALGPIGLLIPENGTFTEPRSAGVTEIVVTYDGDVTAAGSIATIVDACDAVGAVDVSGIVVNTAQGLSNEVVITFSSKLPGSGLTPGTHDPVRYLVELTGVGGAAADTSREFTVVLGDAFGTPIGTGDARVNAQDNGFVRSLAAAGTPIDPLNASHVRADVFTSGAINAQDNGLVRSLAAEGLDGRGLVVPCP